MSAPWWLFPAVFVATLVLTGLGLNVLQRWHIVDIPNKRSSHNLPTPKGGGMALALVVFVALAAMGWHHPSLFTLAVGGLALAAMGLIDDIHDLGPLPRLLMQVLASVALLLTLNPSLHPLWIWPLALLFLLWAINLYNFMDGSDGLAALQVILFGCGIFAFALAGWYPGQLAWLALALACAALAFALFNFPPARVFLGDAGSAFLGFMLAGLLLIDGWQAPPAIALGLVLLAGFVCDASATLLCRLMRGQRIYQAHRSHVYQLAIKAWEAHFSARGMTAESARAKAHRRYLAVFTLVFFTWQLPFAIALANGALAIWLALVLVYVPLFTAALLLGAGQDTLLPYGAMRRNVSR